MPSIDFAEPDMTNNDSSDGSIRRIADDLGRHKLTDLIEADEKEEDGLDYLNSARRKRFSSITSTASSMDGLWELHPRRLSEAGLSRHSDSNAVLTEDTDSFIIGQRVWVGGAKPGTIAYIGETQFAPGEWAGIALDEPIGKNDGSVGGIRYFQCENKKGVFSRLTRLTRVPLEQAGMGSNETFTSPNNGVRRSPISPTGSTKSLLKSAASLSNSNTSLTSSATHVDFKIGDRVIIKSTQGSKIGTVRYMGLTDFAPGEWVGVELDDPRGKNDGSVEGKRYFDCRPNFGLFAPISKVSKSPSKHKPSACVVHSGQGLPPSGLKRTSSKESLTSTASKTSPASSVRRVRLGVTSLSPKKVSPKTSTPLPTRTALQDVLREKQQHIEQLLKERDLERAEVTRAANQADEAEQRFFTLKQEFEKCRAECEKKVLQNGEILDQWKVNRDELLVQLEDEKRKNEDLQFRFEEASITKGDIEVINETNVKKILELEKNLAEEQQKTEILEQISNKLFEAEENLIKAREENDNLRNEIDKTKKESSATDKERTVATRFVESLQKQIESTSLENEEKNIALSRLNEEMTVMRSEHELFKREVDEFKKKSENSCQEKDAQVEKLKSELYHRQHIVEKFESTHQELLKENEKLKMELSAKSLDLETANEHVADKKLEIKSLQDSLVAVQKQLDDKIDELERYKNNALDSEKSIQKELEQTRTDLKDKILKVEDVKEQFTIQISQKEQQLQEANKTISRNNQEIKKLNDELAELKTNFEANRNEIHSRHARQVASQDLQLMALSAELQQKNEEITKSSIVISKLEEDLCTKNGIIEKLRLELESHENQQSSHTEASATLTQTINELSVSNGDLQRQITTANERIAALNELKQRLEAEIQTLLVRCENSEQLEHFRNEIQVKHNLLETLKAEYEQKLHNSERVLHELELQQETAAANFERVRAELERKLQVSIQTEEVLRRRCESTDKEFAKVQDDLRMKIGELEQSVQEKEFALSNIQEKSSETVMRYQEQLKSVTEQLNRSLQECESKISLLNNENSQLREQVSMKTEELIEAHAKSSHLLAQSQQTENELKQKYNGDMKKLEFELNEKNLQLEKTVTELQLLRNDCNTTNTDLGAKDRKISELTAEVQQAQSIASQLQEQLTQTKSLHQQTTEGHQLVQNQCRDLLEKVASLTEQVRNGEEVFKNLQIEHNNAMHLVNLLKVTEQQKQNCLKQLQQEVSVTSENKSCNAIELLNQMKVDNNTEDVQKILALQKDVEIIRNQLAERNHQLDVQKSELLRLQESLLRAQESNARCTEGSEQDHNSLIQDKELAENQIKFLNSIIVDIQRKNEEQKARIEILEAGCSPAMADELKLIDSSQRQVPPRVYCDICEEFDLHETEDCPKQNTDAVPFNGQRGQKILPQRPYCEICEAFGHATEDCQEDQTF